MNRFVVTLFCSSLLFMYSRLSYALGVTECQVRVLQPFTDSNGNHWQAGTVLPVTIERDDADGGAFCASGGSCLPRKQDGKEAVRLINCQVGPTVGGSDYRLVPNAQVVGRATATRMRSRASVAQALSALGFSNASAGTLADDYVGDPSSSAGKQVGRALHGSSAAIAALKKSNP